MIDKDPRNLTFRNLDLDIERTCVQTGETIGGIPVLRGYDEAREFVFSTYLDKKQYGAVVDYLLEQNWEWGVNQFVERATDALKRDGELDKLKRLWRGVIASQKQNYWATYAIRNESPDAARILPKAKSVALQHMARYRDILEALDASAELSRLNDEIASFEQGKQRRSPAKTDPRQMDEMLFWMLIEDAKNSSDSIARQLEALTSSLEAFGARDIKRFRKILAEKMVAAYHWDLWALATIAQGGCSDDGFADFRAWLILQGRQTFELALTDIRNVLDKLPAGLTTQAEGLHSVAEIAYERRTGRFLRLTQIPLPEPKGRPWEEGQLEARYPEVCRYYDQ